MRLNLILALLMGLSFSAHADDLKVTCTGHNHKSVNLHSSIKNVNSPQEIKSLIVNGVEQTNKRDASSRPFYKNGDITLSIQFGRGFFSSVNLSLSKCRDSFEATGSGTLKEYVGGFAGTQNERLNCNCELTK